MANKLYKIKIKTYNWPYIFYKSIVSLVIFSSAIGVATLNASQFQTLSSLQKVMLFVCVLSTMYLGFHFFSDVLVAEKTVFSEETILFDKKKGGKLK